MVLTVSYCVERGTNKSQCDDTALIGRNPINEECGVKTINTPSWICLCDGVGGDAGGKDASMFVCNSLVVESVPSQETVLEEIIKRINKKLLTEASATKDRKLMATTATILAFAENSILLAHVGNTRLYIIRGQFLQQVTIDQTTYQWLINMGNEEAAEHCNKSEIRGAMGGGREELIGLLSISNPFERKQPSVLLLTSDGVHEYIDEDKTESIIGDIDVSDLEKVKLLCDEALKNGSEDDRSAILIRIS